MAAKTTSNKVPRSPVPVEPKTLQALFNTLKVKHSALTCEVKTLIQRFQNNGDVSTLKSMLLQFPPLHSMNDLLDDSLQSPVCILRGTPTKEVTVTPTDSKRGKKRSWNTPTVPASKSLKFSPHLFKKEESTLPLASPTGALDLVAEDTDDGKEADDDDDDLVEIEAM